MNENADKLFASPLGTVPSFSFDDDVARVFPDMIQRSVPGYASVVAITGILSGEFSTPGSYLYDLGCSLGATTLAMSQAAAKACTVVAVDNSAPMISRLQQTLAQCDSATQVEARCEDICETAIDNASVVAMNYTLQFVPREQRQALLEKIYAGMLEGGALVLSEKVSLPDPADDELFVRLHHRFKQANGYSDLEISQKREALENVLLPETVDAHRQRLRRAGFDRIEVWFQCFNFVSLLAIKQ